MNKIMKTALTGFFKEATKALRAGVALSSKEIPLVLKDVAADGARRAWVKGVVFGVGVVMVPLSVHLFFGGAWDFLGLGVGYVLASFAVGEVMDALEAEKNPRSYVLNWAIDKMNADD